jgi:hypothetical protein
MNKDPRKTSERRGFLGLELWQQIFAGLIVALVVGIAGFVGRHLVFSSSNHSVSGGLVTPSEPTLAGNRVTVPVSPTPTPSVANATVSIQNTPSCAITPSQVARIYSSPNTFAPSSGVPVASYPVIKIEQVAFGGATAEWYEIRVQGKPEYVVDEPGQITANSCPPP